jgi:soluble lytic murein transglycosylase-like protein
MRRATAALLLAGAAGLAHAALWGYVDGSGVAHFAPKQIDSRYSLVLGDDGQGPPAAAKVPGKTMSSSSLLTWLDISPEVKRLQPWVRDAAFRHGVDVELINALIAVESGFNARAVSPKGAVGLMQLMPTTAERYLKPVAGGADIAERLAEPRTNITVGTRLIADLLKRHGRIDLALAAWSAGDGAVRRSGGQLPPIDETRAHVQQVLELYWALLQRSHARKVQQMRLHR